jgi:hypothetical protein
MVTTTTSPNADKNVDEDDNSLPPIVTQIRKNMEKHQVYVKHKLGKKPYASKPKAQIEESDDASYEDSMDEKLYEEDEEHESLTNDKVKDNIKELEK